MALEIKVLIECLVFCEVFCLLYYLGTGVDKKNIKSYSSYPDEVQNIVKEREDLKSLTKISIKFLLL